MASHRSKETRVGSLKPSKHGRWVTLGLCLVGLILLVTCGPSFLAWYARQRAERELNAGSITTAQRWLDWASWYRPGDGRADVLRAACFRRLKDVEGFVKALEQAEKKGGPASLIERERRLAVIQAGRLPPGPNNQIGLLIAQGYDPAAVAEVFVYGALARGDVSQAWEILSAWAADAPDDVNQKYMAGIYWKFLNQLEKAETMQRDVLKRQPRHELAMLALAEILTTDDRWQELYELYQEWHRRIPQSDFATIGWARCARLLGRWDEARQILAQHALPSEPSTTWLREAAELQLETHQTEDALKWFDRLDIQNTTDRTLLHAVALGASLQKDNIRATELMDRADQRFRTITRIHELRMKLTMAPSNAHLRSELETLSKAAEGPMTSPDIRGRADRDAEIARSDAEARQLYKRYCAACHGDQGTGDGRAARFLFPRARNLRRDAFRIVSTEDGIPTRDDIAVVIRQGMPGTAMRSFPELSEQEVVQLADLVLEMFREGIREQLAALYSSEGEVVSDEEIQEEVLTRTTPGNRVLTPRIGVPSAEALARGKAAYSTLGCVNCHGDDGTGPCDLALWDDQGFPNPPRDLKHELYKGGDKPELLYLRLRIGMPGTAHPSCFNATPEELLDVVYFCRSLIQEPRRMTTNDQRWQQARIRAWNPAYLTLPGQ